MNNNKQTIKTKKMKRIIVSSALMFAFIISGSTAHSQDMAGGGFLHQENSKVFDPGTGKGYNIIGINEVNIAAARDFMKKYGKAQDIKWVKGKNGTSVYFIFEGVKMRSTYDNKGKREYTLKYYDESAMPRQVRHLVKSNYYDHSIDNVTEVDRNG